MRLRRAWFRLTQQADPYEDGPNRLRPNYLWRLPTDMPPSGSRVEIRLRNGTTFEGTLGDQIPGSYACPGGHAFRSDDGEWRLVQRHMIVRSIEEPGKTEPEWERMPADWWWRR